MQELELSVQYVWLDSVKRNRRPPRRLIAANHAPLLAWAALGARKRREISMVTDERLLVAFALSPVQCSISGAVL